LYEFIVTRYEGFGDALANSAYQEYYTRAYRADTHNKVGERDTDAQGCQTSQDQIDG
jgi:hypothetical protein